MVGRLVKDHFFEISFDLNIKLEMTNCKKKKKMLK